MRFPLALLLLLATVPGLRAQDDPRVFRSSPSVVDTPHTAGAVTIHQSERINTLMTDYASHKQPLKGFRVQVFLGDRTQAEETRRAFLVRHPDIPAYLSYLAPNFRVRVGDLRDRLEAEQLREQLKTEFPGLYVVPEEIELPRLPEAEGK
ncbi:MAG TPA: SPOR domain-containing protein [Flavobacteriales bacterium]|jgi:hypothetical protein|nr:SPOR domain-containing protein [Flavobacteriales bacterium]